MRRIIARSLDCLLRDQSRITRRTRDESKKSSLIFGGFTMARSTPDSASDQNATRAVAEAIAKDTDTSPEVVEEIYQQELSNLASEATITQYLGVIATRRVRMMLQRRSG
jgi:hypothetical protein